MKNLYGIMLFLCARMLLAYEGDGTYYGDGGAGAAGACMLERNFNNIRDTVAMNPYQFENGGACGKCIVVRGDGVGLGMKPIYGPIYATIDNLCPECKHGDVDLGLAGDGRFLIRWEFIPCDEIPSGARRKLRG
jgi:hypothetical protein